MKKYNCYKDPKEGEEETPATEVSADAGSNEVATEESGEQAGE